MRLYDVLQRDLQYIAESLAAARLGHGADNQAVGGVIDVVDLDAGKAFFKQRNDFFRVDLRQRAVENQGSAFFQRLLINLVDGLRGGDTRHHQHSAKQAAHETAEGENSLPHRNPSLLLQVSAVGKVLASPLPLTLVAVKLNSESQPLAL